MNQATEDKRYEPLTGTRFHVKNLSWIETKWSGGLKQMLMADYNGHLAYVESLNHDEVLLVQGMGFHPAKMRNLDIWGR